MTTLSRKSDLRLKVEVTRELRGDTRVGAAELSVEVIQGVVALKGVVDSWARRVAAAEAAHRVAGVRDVAVDIQVRPSDLLERGDVELARAVRSALEWDARVPDATIRSTVSEGRVTLEGSVERWSQREDAEAAVRNLAGVVRVVNALTVRPGPVAGSDVRRAIHEALARQAVREAQRVEASVREGCVTLSGEVLSWVERRAVVDAAGATPGVRKVRDLLRVRP